MHMIYNLKTTLQLKHAHTVQISRTQNGATDKDIKH